LIYSFLQIIGFYYSSINISSINVSNKYQIIHKFQLLKYSLFENFYLFFIIYSLQFLAVWQALLSFAFRQARFGEPPAISNQQPDLLN